MSTHESSDPLSTAGIGLPIPDAPHAVSVSLPTWESNVGYEEGDERVVSRMQSGYPRFFMHHSIRQLAEVVAQKYASPDEESMLLPTPAVGQMCLRFLRGPHASVPASCHGQMRILEFVPCDGPAAASAAIVAVIFPKAAHRAAGKFWQHTGEGVSSRRAEFLRKAIETQYLVPRSQRRSATGCGGAPAKGPRRYHTDSTDDIRVDPNDAAVTPQALSYDPRADTVDSLLFVEERFGRNLDLTLAASAKLAIRRRIATAVIKTPAQILSDASPSHIGSSDANGRAEHENVYLFPTGMSAIFNVHQLVTSLQPEQPCIMFGFPYIDTLKILEAFGAGCVFYGQGETEDLDDLERRCREGQRFAALFCEFPGNPLLKSPDLARIRRLADEHEFSVVVDETIGNFVNVDVLLYADVVVSSLTKVFSGDSNVMGGSCILNPRGSHHGGLSRAMDDMYEDNYWPEDVIYMERNSRDFVSRSQRINVNAEAICSVLETSEKVKQVYYPRTSPSRKYFDQCRTAEGGYGGLLSITFQHPDYAPRFYNALQTHKGPSLGTNFTLSSPYVILAHFHELDWAAKYGVERELVRVSVGLENRDELCRVFQKALDAC